MRRLYGLGSTDGAASSLQEGLNLPSFSVHMMKGGELGGVRDAGRERKHGGKDGAGQAAP